MAILLEGILLEKSIRQGSFPLQNTHLYDIW